MNVAYNMDCLEAMKQMPDNAFDLAVVDPPYGLGITHTHTQRKSYPEQDRSVVRATVYGESKKALSHQRFILRSTTAPRRTRNILGSFSV